MISINFLPHRQMRRQRQRQHLQQLLIGAFAIGVSMVLVGILILHRQSASQRQRGEMLQTELQKLDAQIAQQTRLQKELALLGARLATLDHLVQQRNDAAKLLGELAASVPDTVVLIALKQDHNHLSVHGNAASHQDITRMLARFNETQTLAGAQLRHTSQLNERHDFIITVSRPAQTDAPR